MGQTKRRRALKEQLKFVGTMFLVYLIAIGTGIGYSYITDIGVYVTPGNGTTYYMERNVVVYDMKIRFDSPLGSERKISLRFYPLDLENFEVLTVKIGYSEVIDVKEILFADRVLETNQNLTMVIVYRQIISKQLNIVIGAELARVTKGTVRVATGF